MAEASTEVAFRNTLNKLQVIWAKVAAVAELRAAACTWDRSEDVLIVVVATCAAFRAARPHSSASPEVLWRSSAKFMATFMCRVACAVNTGNAGKKCIINDVINPHAHTPPVPQPTSPPTPTPSAGWGLAPTAIVIRYASVRLQATYTPDLCSYNLAINVRCIFKLFSEPPTRWQLGTFCATSPKRPQRLFKSNFNSHSACCVYAYNEISFSHFSFLAGITLLGWVFHTLCGSLQRS